MAVSDYNRTGEAAMCPTGQLAAPLPLAVGPNTISIANFVAIVSLEEDVNVGDAILVGEEIMRIDDISAWPSIVVSRGCADSVPAEHAAGDVVWFFTNGTGTDNVEYTSGDTIGVKLSPFTFASGEVPLEYVPSHEVTFNWRYLRPYLPGNFKVNGTPWFAGVKKTTPADSGLVFEWVGRNRLSQADQLLGHHEGGVTIEDGVTYTARVYNDMDTLVATYDGITGTTWTYPRASMLTDLPGLTGYVEFFAARDGFDSFFSYRTIVEYRETAGGLGSSLGESLGG